METNTHDKGKFQVKYPDIQVVLAYDKNDPAKAQETLNLIKITDEMLKEHCKSKDALSYTQLRNILQELRHNEGNLVNVLHKLVYIEARQEKPHQKDLVKFIRLLLVAAIEHKKEGIFLDYMDTVVAYHKYYSTK